jgi:hypothetical protein
VRPIAVTYDTHPNRTPGIAGSVVCCGARALAFANATLAILGYISAARPTRSFACCACPNCWCESCKEKRSPSTLDSEEPVSRVTKEKSFPVQHRIAAIEDSATEIVPGLFLSGSQAAGSLYWLMEKQITHVVQVWAVREDQGTQQQLRDSYDRMLQKPCKYLDIHSELSLSSAAEFVAKALSNPKSNVLVWCDNGMSRSPVIVAAALMVFYNTSSGRALERVKAMRGDWRVAPHPAFMSALDAFSPYR